MKLILSILLILLSSQTLAAPAKILIIPFENATSDSKNDPLKTGIPEILTVCFSNSPDQIIIVERSSLDATLSEQSLSWEKYVNQNSIQAIGQVIGANFILRGRIVLKDSKLLAQALLFDVASTALHRSVSGAINLNNICNLENI